MHTEINEEDEPWLLAVPGMPALVAISNDLRKLSANHMVGLRFSEHRELAIHAIRKWKPYEKMARGTIPEGVVMASGNLGRFYFLPDLEVIDTDGLTDATIARTPVTRPNTRRLIAHDRKPPSGYLEQRGVNIWIDAPAASESTALARGDYAVKVGPDLWMPFKTRDPQIVIDLLLQTSPESRPTWTFTQPHSKRAIHYDGGISLLGASLTARQSLFVMLTWRAASGLDTDYKTSLRLCNVDGEEVWAQDYTLLSVFSGGRQPTRHWPPDVPIKTLSVLDIPPDIPPGQYELRLIVYNAHTLTPTVELGVWKPEAVLAHVQVQ